MHGDFDEDELDGEVCEACWLEPEDGVFYTTADDVRLCFTCYAEVPAAPSKDAS